MNYPRPRAAYWGVLCACSFVAAIAAATLLGSVLQDRDERPYPARQIRLLVPFEPGGAIDVMTRTIAPFIAEEIGQPVLVETRPGARGMIGTAAAVRAAPDGYTLVVGSPELASQSYRSVGLPYDPATDLTPVTSFASTPYFVFVSAAASADTVRALISFAKTSPEYLTYASSGHGTSPHLAGAEFAIAIGTKLIHVPYRGSGPAINDLIAGHIDLMFATLPTSPSYLKFARLKVLAVAAPARVSLLPDVPTVAQSGGPDFSVSSWFGILAPRGTPEVIRTRIAESVHGALRRPDVLWRFAALGAVPLEQSVEQFEASYAAEVGKYRRIFKEHPHLLD